MVHSSNFMSILREQKVWRICLCMSMVSATSLIICILFVRSTQRVEYKKEQLICNSLSNISICESKCQPLGSETLPESIVAKTSNLERRPLWGSPKNVNTSRSLFAVAVGIKQKENVDKMVQKFQDSNFVVMIFHYDGIVDAWNDFKWSSSVIHVSADNQTKWWFAKRFLHPDIVAEYKYIFLWDEDLGVENFNPKRYLSIVKDEGFEISQPALEIGTSEVHHLITARLGRYMVHRRVYKHDGKGIQCDDSSTGPPCTGWIEVMAPVFSATAWRCVWHMIQNDLIHAWGLDIHLGYCAQGERTKTIGVVDAEYVVHYGLPTLGQTHKESNTVNQRIEVRRQSYNEYKVFRRRWEKAAKTDQCWTDLYPHDKFKQGSLWPLF